MSQDTKPIISVPRVGIGVMIMKDGRFLLGKRKSSHGDGEYAFPGGHLEHMESFEDCARREVREECGLELANIRFQILSNIKDFAPKHYVHIGLIADWASGEPVVLEPLKCERWDWYAKDALPSPMFAPCLFQLEAHESGRIYRDA